MKKQIREQLHDGLILSLRERFHSRRAELLLSLMTPENDCSILDLGGASGDFVARLAERGLKARYVVADINRQGDGAVRRKGYSFVGLDEDGPLPFGDQQFDLVVCNSVIEHVTVPKRHCGVVTSEHEWHIESWKRQTLFANEIRRVARAYFVQTPHKRFPVEQHTLLPGVNWLSHNRTLSVLRITDRFWIRRGVFVDWHLLGRTEMKTLFPEAAMLVERVLGIPKSIICYRT